MERSLNLGLLAGALDGRTGLPTAEELQQLMADVEVRLILRQSEMDQQLFHTAWYLHSVASVDGARQRYTLPRQRQAFQVSAHIFDLALNQDGWTAEQRLSYGFAAAIGYRRGGLDPNATAIMNKLRGDIDIESEATEHFSTLSMEAGLAFLGFETKTLFKWLARWRRQLDTIAVASELSDLTTTVFGPTQMVVLGVEDLLYYFARGSMSRLQRGRERLRAAATGQAGPDDLNSQWVAAHLLHFSREAEAGSLWNPKVFPPSVPALVREAFTVGNPPILTLWEPQRDLLNGSRSPFDPDIRRMVLAVPTSGGKTLVAQMLAVEYLVRADRGVCYVAPTRSLGREVRRAMASRVRILQKEAGSDQPDYPTFLDTLFDLETSDAPADVEVMTPERLGHLLRHDADAVLDRFGMFVFDEAQLIKESGRGFVLESVIALLDYLTRETDHQITLISAAMGNAGAIAQWLSPDGSYLLHESEWRGPRRLHAAFTTKAHWETTRIESGAGSVWKYRHTTELSGVLRLRTADGQTKELYMDDTDWQLVRKSRDGSRYPSEVSKDQGRSTTNYVMASEMIAELGHAGSVLVVATTRKQAQQLATALAAGRDEQPSLAPLVDFVRQQLGDNHPLVSVLRRGVGFHHARLPIEILEALEEAVRGDLLPYLACTSTLTDGVNLPVRTVVIYDQPFPGQHEDSRLSGARLVNAMGRAGRAGKETEGWIVLVRGAAPTPQDFHDLNPGAEALAVTSSLTTEIALESFARLEEELRQSEDSIFTSAGVAADFISFVWLMLAIEEARGTDPEFADIDGIVGSTLAATQSDQARTRGTRIAEVVRRRYVVSDVDARRRWPRTGTSIGSARAIDDLARRITDELLELEAAGNLADILIPEQAIATIGLVFDELLGLSEAPEWRFRTSIQGDDIDITPFVLLNDWISGKPLPDLADIHLATAPDAAWRIEQLVGVVTEHFQHYLAWTVGALTELINARLAEENTEIRLCPGIGGYIRYGVDSAHALLLMTSGIRSRRLAHAVHRSLPTDIEPTYEDLRSWLAEMDIADWTEHYDATSSEILDLLDFTRVRSRSLLKTLLESGNVAVELRDVDRSMLSFLNDVSLVPARDEPDPKPLAVYTDEGLVAIIASQDHSDVQAILDTGLDLVFAIDDGVGAETLLISLPFGDG
ncbi:helicase II [Rhodococcus sp. ACPA4]|uniref:DEAD/DEAH box helicase n=1 Tax=Rhodococcus sp. ACPA4 TaxID=2028571 RepID=UPI000BB12408|nr:DEAD/DEAH box helicase [Rhodococcus sp. ACPA4]PBC36089.1 helicase II [Rhodococcus sp. ACPA4]